MKWSGNCRPQPPPNPTGKKRDKNLRRFVLNNQPFIVIHTNRMDGSLPTYLVRRQDPPVIFIATNHSTYQRLRKGQRTAYKEFVRHSLVEAATLFFTADRTSEFFRKCVYENCRQIEERLAEKSKSK